MLPLPQRECIPFYEDPAAGVETVGHADYGCDEAHRARAIGLPSANVTGRWTIGLMSHMLSLRRTMVRNRRGPPP